MRNKIKRFIKSALISLGIMCIPVFVFASILGVQQGGTGGNTFTIGQCIVGNGINPFTSSPCGSGGGGGAGTWASTTSQVPNQIINYSNANNPSTDIVTVGGTSTTTAKFWFDPNALLAKIVGSLWVTASSTFANFTANNATTSQATTTSFAITGIQGFLLKTASNGAVVPALSGTDYQPAGSYVLNIGPAGQLQSNSTITIASSTTGTDFSITGSGNTLTWNLPTASASNRGLLSSADWTTFNNKGSGTVTAVSVATANGLAGSSSGGATPALTLSTTVNSNVLKGNGTAISGAVNGTDYTLLTTTSCSSGNAVNAVTAAGGVTCGAAFSTTSADAYINASSTIAHPSGLGTNLSTGGLIQWDGSKWVAVATSSLGFTGGGGSVTGVTGTYPIASSGGTAPNITFNGLSTTSPWTNSNLAYVINGNTVSSVATSTLTASSPLTGSFTQVGTGGALGCTTAASGVAGCLSNTAFDTFNNKQASGNYITALTGDVTASGPGSVAATLATVNGNVGSFGGANSIPTFTVNGKGLITAAGAATPSIPASEITAGTFGSGNYIFPGQLQVNSSTTLQNFTALNSTSTNATTTGFAITGLARPSGTVLAVDQNGSVIATTTGVGTVTSVSSSASSLTCSPTTGNVLCDINLGHANTFTVSQSLNSSTNGFLGWQATNSNTGITASVENRLTNNTTQIASFFYNSNGYLANKLRRPDQAGIWTTGNGGLYFGALNGSGDDILMSTDGNATDFIIASTTGHNIGIGTSSPYATLSVNGQTVAAYFTATTSTASQLPYASTTAISSSNLVSGNCVQAGTGGLLTTTGSICGSTYPFPLTGNATSTLTQFNGGLTSYASTTIGNGLTNGGLTVSGNSTTTGNAVHFGPSSCGTTLPNLGGKGLEICNDDNVITGGVNFTVGNTNSGANAFSNNLLFNDLANDHSTTHYAGLIYQSSGFNSNFYGTGINTANSLIVQNTDGPLQFVASTSTAPGYISFFTASSSIASERMRIVNGGNVGIGTTSPYTKFSVDGRGVFNQDVRADFFTATSTVSPSVFTGGLTAYASSTIGAGATTTGLTVNGFATTTGGMQVGLGATSALSVVFNGNVGVASSTPWRKFSVVGTMAVNGLTAVTGGNAICLNATTFDFQNAGLGTCATSALRFKENINYNLPSNFAMNELMQLRPVSFDYKDGYHDANETAHSYGLIAEDVEKVDPALVDYCNDGEVCSLHFEKITGLLVKAIQELDTKVGQTRRSVEENWQWIIIALLGIGFIYQQLQIRKLRK